MVDCGLASECIRMNFLQSCQNLVKLHVSARRAQSKQSIAGFTVLLGNLRRSSAFCER
jgi:hypothetical protein